MECNIPTHIVKHNTPSTARAADAAIPKSIIVCGWNKVHLKRVARDEVSAMFFFGLMNFSNKFFSTVMLCLLLFSDESNIISRSFRKY